MNVENILAITRSQSASTLHVFLDVLLKNHLDDWNETFLNTSLCATVDSLSAVDRGPAAGS